MNLSNIQKRFGFLWMLSLLTACGGSEDNQTNGSSSLSTSSQLSVTSTSMSSESVSVPFSSSSSSNSLSSSVMSSQNSSLSASSQRSVIAASMSSNSVSVLISSRSSSNSLSSSVMSLPSSSARSSSSQRSVISSSMSSSSVSVSLSSRSSSSSLSSLVMSSSSRSAVSSSLASDPSGPPVATPAPNASNQTPAFVGQTRISEVRSGISLKQQALTSSLSSPWGMEILPDGRLLISERTGNLVIVSTTGQISSPISGLPSIVVGGQGGLLDVSLAPDFATSRMIYFSFSQDRGSGKNATAVARARLSTNEANLENVQIIFQQQPAWNSSLHFGSRLVWNNAGLLYVTLGERSNPDSRVFAQDINTHLGKVIRINADGTSPATNPYFNNPNAKPEVWSYGHRNPQSAAIHPVTGDLWTVEHGPRGGDELNRPEAGKNYGWPIITYGIDYSGSPIGTGITSQNGMEQPVYYWDPVIAPAGMTFYRGDLFPSWKGNLFISSMNPGGLVRLMFNGNRVVGEERLANDLGRVRDIAEATDGALWVITDSGQLVRLTPQ